MYAFFNLSIVGVMFGWIAIVNSSLCLLYALDKIFRLMAVSDDQHSIILLVFTCYASINLITCIASVLVIIGGIKRNHILLIPWLILETAAILMLGANILTMNVYGLAFNEDLNAIDLQNQIGTATAEVIICTIQLYLYYRIYSVYKMYKTEYITLNAIYTIPLLSSTDFDSIIEIRHTTFL